MVKYKTNTKIQFAIKFNKKRESNKNKQKKSTF